MLTIGLPFYNNEKTLANAIRSVLMQSYNDFELILINDGSTDGSFKIAAEFARTDQRITLINDGQNRGLIYRLNQVIDLAKGDYIARMDADDMMLPAKLQRQMEVILQDNSIDVIDTAAYIINEKDEPAGIRGMVDINSGDKKKVLLKALLFHPTVIAKTSWYRKNKYSSEYFRGEDWELWCRTSSYTRFYRIKEPLFLYREGNVNVKNYMASMKIYRKIIRNYGPGTISKAHLKLEITKSYLKSWLYYFSSFFNLQYLITARRNSRLSSNQTEEVKKIIHKISIFPSLS
jgi:glycosyltransferase involved in cell wall biosynthesis